MIVMTWPALRLRTRFVFPVPVAREGPRLEAGIFTYVYLL